VKEAGVNTSPIIGAEREAADVGTRSCACCVVRGVRGSIDTRVPQEQTISGALNSACLEGDSADTVLGAHPAAAKPAREMLEHLRRYYANGQ